jgi:hypothetical protein
MTENCGRIGAATLLIKKHVIFIGIKLMSILDDGFHPIQQHCIAKKMCSVSIP